MDLQNLATADFEFDVLESDTGNDRNEMILHQAVRKKDVAQVRTVLDTGGHVFLESRFPVNDSLGFSSYYMLNRYASFSPLHLAVKYLRLDVVELLLNEGADISKKNQAESTALHIAFEAKTKGIWKTWQDLETNDKIIDLLLDVKLKDSAKLIDRHGISHLHIACSRDRPEVIRSLLEEKSISASDFAHCDDQGFSPLHFAANYRCQKVAKLLLQYNVDVNQRDDEYRTPLHVASKEPSVEFVRLLMQHGADPTLKDFRDCTPVHLAFNNRNFAVLDLIVTDPTIIYSNPTDDAGISHFHIACTRDNVDLVRAFIDAGVSVDLQVPHPDIKLRYSRYNKGWRGCVPLHFAAAFNRVKNVEILLEHGADVHKKDAKGFCPIHVACQQTYDRFGDYISATLQNWKNDSSIRTLDWMALQMLNRPYSDVTLVDEETEAKPFSRRFPCFTSQLGAVFETDGNTLIDWLSNRQEQIDIIRLLFENGADLNVLDNFGNAPLIYICAFNVHKMLDVMGEKLHLDEKLGTLIARDLLTEMYIRRTCVLKVIFNFGVYINVDKCHNNGSILHYICQRNEFYDMEKVKMLRYFLKKNADPDAIDNSMRTPLHTAVENSHTDEFSPADPAKFHIREPLDDEEVIITLLKNNARVDFRNGKGQTPLFSACLTKKCFLTNILLRHGADVNIEDNNGQTVFILFYKTLVKNLARSNTRDYVVWIIAKTLVEHVNALEVPGFYVGENVENPTWQMNRYLRTTAGHDDSRFKVNLEKEVEELKSTTVNNQKSLFDVLVAGEHRVSRGVIIEQLGKMLNESCRNNFPNYFHFINHKYNVAVERKRLLSEAKLTLNRLLSTNFPEVCSDIIFMPLENIEIARFVKAFLVYTNLE